MFVQHLPKSNSGGAAEASGLLLRDPGAYLSHMELRRRGIKIVPF